MCAEILSGIVLQMLQILMGIEAILRSLGQMYSHVIAMVGYPLVIGDDILECHAGLNRALSLPKALYVTSLDFHIQAVNDLLQRLNGGRDLRIVLAEGADSPFHNVIQGRSEDLQLLLRAGREVLSLFVHFSCLLHHIQSMVTDSLEVTDAVHQKREHVRILRRKGLAGNAGKIAVQLILIVVHGPLQLIHLRSPLLIEIQNKAHRGGQRFLRVICHPEGCLLALLNGIRGRGNESGIQHLKLALSLADGTFLVRNRKCLLHKTNQKFRCGEHEKHGNDIENTVEHGDHDRICRFLHDREMDHCIQAVENNHEYACFNQTVEKLKKRCTDRVSCCADRADNTGDCRADVLTHDDGNGTSHRKNAGQRQGLQNTDGCGRALQNNRDDKANEKSEDRIGKCSQKAHKFRIVRKRSCSLRHCCHTEKKHAEACQNAADILLLLLLAEHHHENTDQSDDRREIRGLKERQENIVTLNSCQRQEPCRDRGTDVGTEDDADRLIQRHDLGIDKADYHDNGGTGRLNDCRHQHTEECALPFVGGQRLKDVLHLSARDLFQALPKRCNAIKEQDQSSDDCKNTVNIHRIFLHSVSPLLGV